MYLSIHDDTRRSLGRPAEKREGYASFERREVVIDNETYLPRFTVRIGCSKLTPPPPPSDHIVVSPSCGAISCDEQATRPLRLLPWYLPAGPIWPPDQAVRPANLHLLFVSNAYILYLQIQLQQDLAVCMLRLTPL